MVLLKAQAADRFLRKPDPSIRAVLLFGPDQGMVASRSRALAELFVDDISDPFNVSRLSENDLSADPGRLADETGAQSLMGGLRLVVVENAGSATAAITEAVIETLGAEVFLLVSSGDLKPSARLRKIFEKADNAAAIGSYQDTARSIETLVTEQVREWGLTIEHDAAAYLASILGADRLVSLSELEKLCLYCRNSGSISVTDVDAICADASESTFDEIIDAVAEGRPEIVEQRLRLALESGHSTSGLLLVFVRHLFRIQNFLQHPRPDQAVKSARPPIHFKRQDSVRRQVRLWTEGLVRQALSKTAETEEQMRLSADLADVILSRTLLSISRQIARRRARSV